jgi:tRNA 2-(methylsulfanyl)-N6-isopentenyladenosine37 hydroxylase
VSKAEHEKVDELPLCSRTPLAWAESVLREPVALLIDHAFLEKKAANNAMELMTRWPNDEFPGWVETMTGIARDEAAHLSQVIRLLTRRGGTLARTHKNPYANELRLLVRKGGIEDTVDRLLVSALIEARSCERFSVLARAASDPELSTLYQRLFSSELGHYTVFVKLARKAAPVESVEARWKEVLEAEAEILARQEPGPRIHSGVPSGPLPPFHGRT